MQSDTVVEGDAVQVLRGLDEASVDLIVTDIPYGINYKSCSQQYTGPQGSRVKVDRPDYFSQIANDDEVPLEWLPEAYRILKPGSAIYVFCHWSKWHVLFPAVEAAGFRPKSMIVMNKSNWGMGDLRGQFAPKHELLLFATKGRHVLRFPEGRKPDVWDVPVRFSHARRLHPNEKPLSWLAPCIENSSNVGDLVVDPFAGSGSTGVAAQRLGRRYLCIDIDPAYVEVARTRLQAT